MIFYKLEEIEDKILLLKLDNIRSFRDRWIGIEELFESLINITKKLLAGYKFCIFNKQCVIIDNDNIFEQLEKNNPIDQLIFGNYYFLNLGYKTTLCCYLLFLSDFIEEISKLKTEQIKM